MTLQTLLVHQYMSRRLITLTSETEILHALQTFIKNDISSAPVVDDAGGLIGIITQKDCMQVALNAAYHSEYGGLVADFMSTQVSTISPDESIVDAAKRFLENRYHRYPVLKNDRLVGVLSRRDVIRALGDAWQWQ